MINTVIPDHSSRRFRRRPPRIFGEDHTIIPYNYDHAVGNEYVRRLGYKVSENEEFKYVDWGYFRVNGKSDNYAIVLTDCKLYIVIVKTSDVKKFCHLKLHTLKKVELILDVDSAMVNLHTHVNVSLNTTVIQISRIDAVKAEDFFLSLKQVMAELQMDIEVSFIHPLTPSHPTNV